MNKAIRPHPTDYRPHHELSAFDVGISDYMKGRHDNPYTEGPDAQAWDRGSEYAMRVCRWHGT